MCFRPRVRRLLMRFLPEKILFCFGFLFLFFFVFLFFIFHLTLLPHHSGFILQNTSGKKDACKRDVTIPAPGKFTYFISLRISVTFLLFFFLPVL